MGRHWSSRYWIFATTKRTLCVSELLQSLSVPTSLGKKMTAPGAPLHPLNNLHVRDLTGDDAGVHLYRHRRDGVGLALERHSRERRTLDARGCLDYRGRRDPSTPLVVKHVDRPLPAQMLILSVWLSPVCRSAPAGFQTADPFLHLRDAPRAASRERPWPGPRCWRKARGDFLAFPLPRNGCGGLAAARP